MSLPPTAAMLEVREEVREPGGKHGRRIACYKVDVSFLVVRSLDRGRRIAIS